MRAVKKSPMRTYWPVGAILLAGLGISGALGARFHRQAVQVDRARFQRVANQVIEALDARVEKTELIMRQAQDYLSSQRTLTDAVFQDWVWKHDLVYNLPWCYGLAFYTNKNTVQWRKLLPPDPRSWSTNDAELFVRLANETPIELGFGFARATSESYHHRWPSISFQSWHYPAGTNSNISDVVRGVAGNRVKSTGRQVYDDGKGNPRYGAALVLPVFDADREALENVVPLFKANMLVEPFYWNTCRGILVASIDYVPLESDVWNDIPREAGVEIFASGEPKRETWLNPKAEGPRALDPHFRPYLSATPLWKMYGERWAVFIYTLPLFEEASPRRLASLTFFAGVGMTVLASALVAVALRARGRQEQMTEEVIEARDALAAAEKERERLGHDLHDGAIQSLYAVQLRLGRVEHELDGGSKSFRDELFDARAELDAVIGEIRRFILVDEQSDRPVDLSAVLQAMTQRSAADGGSRVELHCAPGASERLSSSQAIQVANIAREALSNALRHAKANRVKLALLCDRDSVRLEVTDDGVGFNPEELRGQSIGLTSMTARTQDLHGRLEIESARGRGTRVVVRIPASQAQATATS